jgi:hypothetical protein
MVHLYIDEKAVVWVRPTDVEWFEDEQGFAAALSRCLDQVKQQWRWFDRNAVNVWLSGALARPFVVEAVDGLSSIDEARALAQAAAPAATGLAAPCAVQMESAPVHRAVVATAVERRALDALLDALRQSKVVARSIRPAWAGAIDDRLRQQPQAHMVCFIEPCGATLLAGEGPSLAMTAAHADAAKVDALMRRVCIGQGIAADRAAVTRLDLQRLGSTRGMEWSMLGEALA